MATKGYLKTICDIGSIFILGTRFDLVFSVDSWANNGSPGEVNLLLSKIFIDTSLSDDRISEIILHEVMEVIFDRFTLRGSHDGIDEVGRPINHAMGHPELCAIEYGISEFFRTNPKFSKLYMKSLGRTIGNTYETNKAFNGGIKKGDAEAVFKNLTKTEKKKSRTGGKKSKA